MELLALTDKRKYPCSSCFRVTKRVKESQKQRGKKQMNTETSETSGRNLEKLPETEESSFLKPPENLPDEFGSNRTNRTTPYARA
jgi:hypothetical protein